MLSQAAIEIHRCHALEEQRQRQSKDCRRQMRQLDAWLNAVEGMLEGEQRTVPEQLVKQIAGFLRAVDPKLHRALLRNRSRDAARVLDVIFNAQESLVPRPAEVVA